MDKYFSKYTTYSISEDNFVFDTKNIKFKNIVLLNKIDLDIIENSEAVNRILSSVQLVSGSNTLIIPLLNNQEFALKDLPTEEEIHVLAFGLKSSALQLQGFDKIHTPYQIRNFNILFALPIVQYISNKEAKNELWSSLKQWKKIKG